MVGITRRAKNSQFRRSGQHSRHAKLTDHEVEVMRQLHEVDGLTTKELAAKFDLSKGQASKILRFKARL